MAVVALALIGLVFYLFSSTHLGMFRGFPLVAAALGVWVWREGVISWKFSLVAALLCAGLGWVLGSRPQRTSDNLSAGYAVSTLMLIALLTYMSHHPVVGFIAALSSILALLSDDPRDSVPPPTSSDDPTPRTEPC